MVRPVDAIYLASMKITHRTGERRMENDVDASESSCNYNFLILCQGLFRILFSIIMLNMSYNPSILLMQRNQYLHKD